MKRDKARKWTDRQLARMERQLKKIYGKAKREVADRWREYMLEVEPEIAGLEKELAAAQKANATKRIESLAARIEARKKELTIMDIRFGSMVRDLSWQIAHVNQSALAYLNGETPKIYIVNFNRMKDTADGLGVAFNLVDEHTVSRLITVGDIKLPQKRLNIIKDMRWNTKQMNSAVLQGILQGDSMNKIADRIAVVVGNNETAAMRNARTMVTGAENRGRLDSMHEMDKKGIIMKKRWLATHDGRTRDWHLDMDGQEQLLNEPFIDGHGNELDYPGDPSASPESVYNCRCSMEEVVVGFRWEEDGYESYI